MSKRRRFTPEFKARVALTEDACPICPRAGESRVTEREGRVELARGRVGSYTGVRRGAGAAERGGFEICLGRLLEVIADTAFTA